MDHSSGDLLADRRYRYAEAAFAENDALGAADLARQVLEIAPRFAAAWFLLGQAEAANGAADAAIAAFERVLQLDPDDRQGAGLRLAAAFGIGDAAAAMSSGYVTALFDEYAGRFDRHLTRSLGYRGPALLHDAVRRACSLRLRAFRFDVMLDLGCGTGLAGRAFAPECSGMHGVDLSAAMIAKARETRLYDDLSFGELSAWLGLQPEASADLVLAADVFVYVGDLALVFAQVGRVLAREGLFAFTVQAHAGEGAVLGDDLRYAHGEAYLRHLADDAALRVVLFEPVSTRRDRGQDVPGFLAVLGR